MSPENRLDAAAEHAREYAETLPPRRSPRRQQARIGEPAHKVTHILGASLLGRLDKAAEYREVSRSEIVRQAVVQWLEANEPETPPADSAEAGRPDSAE